MQNSEVSLSGSHWFETLAPDFPGDPVVKNLLANAGGHGSDS